MLTRLLRVTLPALLAGTFGLDPAHADLYTGSMRLAESTSAISPLPRVSA